METRPAKVPEPDHPITIKQNTKLINVLLEDVLSMI